MRTFLINIILAGLLGCGASCATPSVSDRPTVYVFGEVGHQGEIPMPSSRRVEDVLNQAVCSDRARFRWISVIRRINGTKVKFTVSETKSLEVPAGAQEFFLAPGDVVFVPNIMWEDNSPWKDQLARGPFVSREVEEIIMEVKPASGDNPDQE